MFSKFLFISLKTTIYHTDRCSWEVIPKQSNKISEEMDDTNQSILGPVASFSKHGVKL